MRKHPMQKHILVGALLPFALFACRGAAPAGYYAIETAPGSGTWSQVESLPAWVTTKPVSRDRLVFVGENASNARSIALHDGGPVVTAAARKLLLDKLTGLLAAAELERAVAATLPSLMLVQRAIHEQVLTPELVPGNTLCTAWAMWELPLTAVLAALPAAVRGEAEQRLQAAG
jgi:hypothetical protein